MWQKLDRLIWVVSVFALAILQGCGPPPAADPPIKLSAGVALPQLGPNGTMMMFSVDYRFREDNTPDPAGQYFWVIQPANGEPWEQPVQLKKRSTLQAMNESWRPEMGPFTSRIEAADKDGKRRTISEDEAMR